MDKSIGICPRNSLVLLRIKKASEQKVGSIVVPKSNDEYTEAVVMGVGPGTIAAAGGVSETADLKIGDSVLVKHRSKLVRPGPGGLNQISYRDEGLKLRRQDDPDGELYMFEQAAILAVIESQPDREYPVEGPVRL